MVAYEPEVGRQTHLLEESSLLVDRGPDGLEEVLEGPGATFVVQYRHRSRRSSASSRSHSSPGHSRVCPPWSLVHEVFTGRRVRSDPVVDPLPGQRQTSGRTVQGWAWDPFLYQGCCTVRRE